MTCNRAVPSPVPVSAAYRPLTGSVTVTFDAPLGPAVHVDRLHVREAGRGDTGVVALSGRPTVEGAVLTVALDAGRAGSIGAMASPWIDVGGGAVQDIYGNPVPAAAGLPLDVPDTVPPVLDSATYHRYTGLLSVSFSEPLNHTATDYPGLAIIGPSGNLTLADAADRATPDGGTIAATLDQTRRGMVGPGSALKVSGGAITDESGNRIEPVTVPITLTANLPPTVDAGPDRTIPEGDGVTLNGTATDPDGDPLTYRWSHDSAPAINLSNATAPSTAFTAPEVDADTVVIFTLTADDGRGVSSTDTVSVTILDGSPPDPPQNLRFGATTNTTITLIWDDPGDATITGYKVLSRAALTEPNLAVLVSDTGSADTTHTVTGLDPDTIYVFRVIALGEHGESAWSNFVRLPTAPADSSPTADAGPDRAVAEGSSVTLSGTAVHIGRQPAYLWTHDRPDLDIALAGSDTLSPSFTAPNVDSDTAVTFTLSVTDQHNTTAADRVTITISDVPADDPPAAPQNLRFGAATNTTITLIWDDPGDATITGYKVLSRAALTEPNLAVLVSNTGSADTTHTVTGLDPDTIYVFRVIALGEHGESAWSNFVRPSTLP